MSECAKCGKTAFDFDSPDGCLEPGVYSPGVGDWVCRANKTPVPAVSGWQQPETAPKDRKILADMGYPWPLVVVYSPADQSWSGAEVEASMYQGVNEFYFVTERFSKGEMLGWMEMPEVMPRPNLNRWRERGE